MQVRPKPFFALGFLSWALVSPAMALGQALAAPDGWLTASERFVEMPPGFHITTSGSVLLYHPEASTEGDYRLESEGFLFRGDSQGTYGLFVGGANLDADDARWMSFEIGHDGAWVVHARTDRSVSIIAGPEPSEAVAAPGESMTAKNILAIEAGPATARFLVNGVVVVDLPRADLALDGVAGFRVGADLNLHLTTFDITAAGETRRFAPPEPAEEPGEDGR